MTEKKPAYDRALRFLERRAYSTEEIRQRLARNGYEAAAIEQTIARLTRAGLLDDAAYARQVARSKLVGARFGARRVRQELARRGVPRQLIGAAVEEVTQDEEVDSSAQAIEVARRRSRDLAGLDPVVQRRRLYAYLARRGFGPDDITAAVRVALRDVRP